MEVEGNAEVTLCNYESVEFASKATRSQTIRRKMKAAPSAAKISLEIGA
jgi:hypothetical protein